MRSVAVFRVAYVHQALQFPFSVGRAWEVPPSFTG